MSTVAAETRSPGGGRPLAAHRWFPAAVALWFAALFGLCSLAVPAAMLERVVSAAGIDRVIPAAAPPLGETARLLIAAGLSTVGEIFGLLIGRRIAGRRRRRVPQPVVEAVEPIAEDRAPLAPQPASSKPSSLGEPLGETDDDLMQRQREIALERDASVAVAATGQAGTPLAGIAAASLETLGVVQLSERLALAMRGHRPRVGAGSQTLAAFLKSSLGTQAADDEQPAPTEMTHHGAPESLQRLSGTR